MIMFKGKGWRLVVGGAMLILLNACGDNAPEKQPPATPAAVGRGGQVSVRIVPEQPTSGDCLSVIITNGQASGLYRWMVNDREMPSTSEARLCNDFFKRGDRVMAQIGEVSSESVTIANSPPKVTGIATSPAEWRSGTAIEIVPAAEDADGDPVEFRYRWVINGVEDSFLSEATLPAERNRRGDRIEVLVTPFDGREEGPVFKGAVNSVAGSAPTIVSTPPTRFEALVYTYQVQAKDIDNDPLTFALDTPPAGMTIDPATGLISWPLSGIQPGKYEVKIVVRDPEGGEDHQRYELVLGEPKPAEATK